MSNIFDKKNQKNLTPDAAEIGKRYKIVASNLPEERKIRFFEMGLTPGTDVTLLKVAPAGDPLEIELRGYKLCIRKKDAKQFVIRDK